MGSAEHRQRQCQPAANGISRYRHRFVRHGLGSSSMRFERARRTEGTQTAALVPFAGRLQPARLRRFGRRHPVQFRIATVIAVGRCRVV